MGSDPLEGPLDVLGDGWWLGNGVASRLVALEGERMKVKEAGNEKGK